MLKMFPCIVTFIYYNILTKINTESAKDFLKPQYIIFNAITLYTVLVYLLKMIRHDSSRIFKSTVNCMAFRCISLVQIISPMSCGMKKRPLRWFSGFRRYSVFYELQLILEWPISLCPNFNLYDNERVSCQAIWHLLLFFFTF